MGISGKADKVQGRDARAIVEVWFVPDSGGAERKLMEKVFKIEGWQR